MRFSKLNIQAGSSIAWESHIRCGTRIYFPFRLIFIPLSSRIATSPTSIARSVRASWMKLSKP